MNKCIAVIAPKIGVRSETFIRRHMNDLLPDSTVVIAKDVEGGEDCWKANGPYILLNKIKHNFKQKTIFYLKKKFTFIRIDDRDSESIKKFLNENNVSVIMSEYLDFSLRFFEVSQELNIPFFSHAHGFDISSALKDPQIQTRYLQYNQSAGVITISEISRLRLIKIGLEPSKVHVIPCGVNVPEAPLIRADKSSIRCIAVGRMVPKKAPILLLESFRQAAERYPALHLDYIGSGPLFPAVKQFIQAFNLTDRVTLYGGQPSHVVQNKMQEADIFLQHSAIDPDSGDEEGLPVAILEAMSNALPVVSTFHAGIPEAVSDGETGFLVQEGDISSMANKILHLAQDSTLRSELGVAAWQRAKEFFTWEHEKNQLRQLMKL